MIDAILSLNLSCNQSSVYRIYIDDDLITERDYSLSNTQYINEVIPLKLERGIHAYRIENLTTNNGTFSINNITINGNKITSDKEFII